MIAPFISRPFYHIMRTKANTVILLLLRGSVTIDSAFSGQCLENLCLVTFTTMAACLGEHVNQLTLFLHGLNFDIAIMEQFLLAYGNSLLISDFSSYLPEWPDRVGLCIITLIS